jgi:hypothetical protein
VNKRNWFAASMSRAGLAEFVFVIAASTSPALAQLTIDTDLTSPVKTSEAPVDEDLIIDSTGSIVIDLEGPIITIDTDTDVVIETPAELKNNADSNMIGIDIEIPDAGRASNLDIGGRIILGETGINLPVGSNNTGIRVGVDGGIGTLTGNMIFRSTVSARVQGNDSVGIDINQPVIGNLEINGTINVTGSNAQGVVSTAAITGQMAFRGVLVARGTGYQKRDTRDPVAGSALAIGASISKLIDHDDNIATPEILIGGVLVNGPILDFVDSTTNFTSQTISVGGAPAVYISPRVAGAAAEDIVLGRFSDFDNITDLDLDNDKDLDDLALDPNFDPTSATTTHLGLFSFVNRGKVESQGVESGVDTEGFRIEGDGVHSVTFEAGLYNNGAILAMATNHNFSVTDEAPTPSDGTALIIGDGASIPTFFNDGTVTGESKGAGVLFRDGSVTGDNHGAAGGTAIGVLIEPGGTLPSITNNSAINAFSSLDVVENLNSIESFAILDQSGTLLNIENTGLITATNSSGSTAVAIDVSATTDAVTVTNTQLENRVIPANILGDLRFGSAPDNVLTIDGHVTNAAGVISRATVDGRVIATGGVDVSVTDGMLRTEEASVRNLVVGSASAPISEAGTIQFLLENTPNVDPIITASGMAGFHSNATVSFSSMAFLGSDGAYPLLRASQGIELNGQNLDEVVAFNSPFLFDSSFVIANDGDIDTLSLVLQRKSVTDLGLTGNAAAVFEPALTAAGQDNIFGQGLLGITDEAGVEQSLNSLIPNVGVGARALYIAVTNSITGPVGRRQRSLIAAPERDLRFWGQQFYQDLNAGSTATSPSFFGSGMGISVGMEWGQTPTVRYGTSYTYFAGQVTESGSQITKENIALSLASVYASWRSNNFFVTPQANIGYASYKNRRRVVAGPITRRPFSNWNTFITTGGVTSGFMADLGAFEIVPHISIDGLYAHDNAYTERLGGDGVNLSVGSRTTRSLRLFAGVVAQTEFMLDDGIMKPQILAGWSKDLANDSPVIDASFEATPGSDFSVVGPVSDSSRVIGGASFSYLFDNWSAAVNYDASHTSGALAQSATVSMTSRF